MEGISTCKCRYQRKGNAMACGRRALSPAQGKHYRRWAKGVIASTRKALSQVGEGRYRQHEESIIAGGRRALSPARGKHYHRWAKSVIESARKALLHRRAESLGWREGRIASGGRELSPPPTSLFRKLWE